MSPLGKFTLALLGLRFFGAAGFFWGLFLGHVFIDKTKLIKILKKQLSIVDDNIRLLLPYRFYRYYNRIEGNFWGKLWGTLFGGLLYGLHGFILFFIVGHFVFDTPNSRHACAFRAYLDDFFNTNLGKLLGGIIGFCLNSRVLLFSGIIIGFFADCARSDDKLHNFFSKTSQVLTTKLEQLANLFTKCQNPQLRPLAVLAAKIAKADGQVSENEIRVFKQIAEISDKDRRTISQTFNKAKKSCQGYECYAKRIKQLTLNNLTAKEDIIEKLFKIASADNVCNAKQMEILIDIAKIIELPQGNFDVIKQSFEPQTKYTSNVKNFYDVLGVFCNASDKEIKSRWKELINIYHPDRVQANGASEEEVEKSTQKMAEINNAYQSIMKSRRAA